MEAESACAGIKKKYIYIYIYILHACSYFQNLVATFESKMELYRRQIEELESHLSAANLEIGLSSQSQYVCVSTGCLY